MENAQLLTVQDAARELGITDGAVRTALSESRLPFTVMLGRKAISRADLDAYKARTRPNGEKPRGRPRKAAELTAQTGSGERPLQP